MKLNNRGFLNILLMGLIILVILGFLIFKIGLVQPNDILNNINQTPQQTAEVPIISEYLIDITKDGFIPATIKIKKGAQVKWINKDKNMHWIQADPHPTGSSLPQLDSAEGLEEDVSYGYTFDQSGTYMYHDHLNPLKFKGTVIVE